VETAGAMLVLCRPADVAMMQAADFGTRDDRAERGRLDMPSNGRVLLERKVSASPVIVREIRREDSSKMTLAEDDDMVQALAPDRADEPLREGILPRAVRGRENLLDPHALHAVPKLLAVDLVTIAQKIGGRGVVREGVHDLLGGPAGGGVLGHVEVDDPPAVLSEYDEDEEDAEASGRHGEEVDRDQVADMVGEERSPGLRRRAGPLREQPGHGAFGHADAELEKLTMNSRGAPERIRDGHADDQSTNLGIDGWPAGDGPIGELGPVLAEATPRC
jgi:hypothetical protein